MDISLHLIKKYKSILSNFRFIIVQHLMEDTYTFVKNLIANDIEIHSLFYKRYSIEEGLISKLKAYDIEVLPDDEEIDTIIKSAVKKTIVDRKKIVILDLGGVFSELDNSYDSYIQCIVEDTHFGHWKYKNKVKGYPIYSVAESKLKEMEAIVVGKSTTVALYEALLSIGISIIGKKVLVIGYGMIGKNVAQTLKNMGLIVYVNDIHQYKMLNAIFEGCDTVHDYCKHNNQFDIIIGTTGTQSINKEVINTLKDRGFICSSSSKNLEIDMDYLENNALTTTQINNLMTSYCVNGKSIIVLNEGYPINFTIHSVPDEIIDLLFSEMVACIVDSTKEYDNYEGTIRIVPERMIDYIAGIWMIGDSHEN